MLLLLINLLLLMPTNPSPNGRQEDGMDPGFLQDFRSRLWITYRENFPAIERSDLKSDTGWGCMLRSAQMIMAQGLLVHFLGRSWRLPEDPRLASDPGYLRVAKFFFDYASPFCPFSIHNLLAHRHSLGKELGEWFGPEASCQLLRESRQAVIPLVAEDLPDVFVSPAGRLCLAELRAAVSPEGVATAGPEKESEQLPAEQKQTHAKDRSAEADDRAVFVFLPVRLGVDRINPIYVPGLLRLFMLPQCLGMIGGRPRSSLYFMGVHGNRLMYLDPHTVQEVPRMNYHTQEDLRSFHCSSVSEIAVENIDPSLVVGFYCNGAAQLTCLWDCLREIQAEVGPGFPFALLEQPPKEVEPPELPADGGGADSLGEDEDDDFVLIG